MSLPELTEKLIELTKELIKDRAAVSTGTTPKSPAKIKTTRHTIARIHQTIAIKHTEAKPA